MNSMMKYIVICIDNCKNVTKGKGIMIKCPYCEHGNTEEEIFCEECGRPLKKSEKKKKIQKRYEMISWGNFSYVSATQIIVQDDCSGCLKFPDTQSLREGKWELVFRMDDGCNLAEYLSVEEHQNIREFINIETRLLQILETVQSKGFIVGSCDLEDLFLVNNNPKQMVLRIVRPLLSKNKLVSSYSIGEFAAPEVRNQNEQLIDERTDVYLAAIIFNRLIIRNKYSAGNIDAQLFWGYTLTNGAFIEEGKKIRRFHHWLGDTLNMYPTKRKRKVKDARLAFEKCCELKISKLNHKIEIEDCLRTDEGKGKKEFMKNAGVKECEWNEDSIEKWEREICGEKVRAYMLADGISNCDIGSGYYASNIIRENFKRVLDEYVDEAFDDVSYDMVENLVYEIVERSNKDIWKKACEYCDKSGSIMGSTFVFIFIIAGGMYTYYLGDSPLYLIRKGNAIPLYSPDSAGYIALKNGMSYNEFRQMEGKDSIALYIGGEYSRAESDYYLKRNVDVMTLQENDIIIATSDGVLDYMGGKLSDTEWDKEAKLVEILTSNKPTYRTLEGKAKGIIDRNNGNGGGDNLSMILIKAGGRGNE